MCKTQVMHQTKTNRTRPKTWVKRSIFISDISIDTRARNHRLTCRTWEFRYTEFSDDVSLCRSKTRRVVSHTNTVESISNSLTSNDESERVSTGLIVLKMQRKTRSINKAGPVSTRVKVFSIVFFFSPHVVLEYRFSSEKLWKILQIIKIKRS